MPFLPPIFLGMVTIPPIKMVMPGGLFMTLFYPHYDIFWVNSNWLHWPGPSKHVSRCQICESPQFQKQKVRDRKLHRKKKWCRHHRNIVVVWIDLAIGIPTQIGENTQGFSPDWTWNPERWTFWGPSCGNKNQFHRGPSVFVLPVHGDTVWEAGHDPTSSPFKVVPSELVELVHQWDKPRNSLWT